MKINVLSKSNTFEIFSLLNQKWRIDIPRQKSLKSFEVDDGKYLLVGDNIIIVKLGKDVLLPYLGQDELLKSFPSIFVDKGAIKFVCNGAKVTRPGITKYDSFQKDAIVIVKEESSSTALAVGLSLVESNDMLTISKGYIVNTLHYMGDDFWQTYRSIPPQRLS